MSLLLNKFVLGFVLAIAVFSGIGFMYWNMNRWKEKAEILENQLEAMTAARDLLLDINSAKDALEKEHTTRREKVEKSINKGDRDFFSGGIND